MKKYIGRFFVCPFRFQYEPILFLVAGKIYIGPEKDFYYFVRGYIKSDKKQY